ncbi:MAG: CBS domain-containing protein [Chloroflexi bacterium]|nr:CBS domain-containing protein [Chloroflexota bacterium]
MSARAAWRLETLDFSSVRRYTAGKVDWLANGLASEGRLASEPRIAGVMQPVATCRLGERVGDVRSRLAGDGDLCVVVNAEEVVLGDLRGKALSDSPAEALVDDVMDPAPSTYRPNVSVHEMAEHLSGTKAQRVLVTTGDGRLLGLLRRDAVMHAAHDGGPYLASGDTA